MIDKAKILEKYKNKKTPIMQTKSNEDVVATEVDENNQLHYVIRRGNELVLLKASKSNLQMRPAKPSGRKHIAINKKHLDKKK